MATPEVSSRRPRPDGYDRPTTAHAIEDYFIAQRAGAFGDFVSQDQRRALTDRVTLILGFDTVTPDEFPRLRRVTAQLEWTSYDRAVSELVRHSDDVPADFDALAERTSLEFGQSPIVFSRFRGSELETAPSLVTDRWRRRWAAIDALEKATR